MSGEQLDLTLEVVADSGSLNRLVRLRGRLFAAIAVSLAEDGHCKSYEGRMEIVLPGYFDDQWGINLHCYVIGPSRHYEWRGKTLDEALDKAESDILAWCAEYEPNT